MLKSPSFVTMLQRFRAVDTVVEWWCHEAAVYQVREAWCEVLCQGCL